MPADPITVDLTDLLRIGRRSRVQLGEQVYEVRFPYEHPRSAQLELDRWSTRRTELQKRMQEGEGALGDLSEEEIAEFDALTEKALSRLVVGGVDDTIAQLAPAQRADLLDAIGLLNMRAMADQKKAVESASSTLLSSVREPTPPPSRSGSSKPRKGSSRTH